MMCFYPIMSPLCHRIEHQSRMCLPLGWTRLCVVAEEHVTESSTHGKLVSCGNRAHRLQLWFDL
jgi:hypothetical protein